MTALPMVPKPGTAICIADIERLEAHVAREVAAITDVEQLQEWKSQAAALKAYLRGKELHGPMLGAQRRVEARIGQLLGDAREAQCRPGGALPCEVKGISGTDRQRFRILARGLERGLADDEWRSGRRSLIELIQSRYPMPKRQPEVVIQKDGVVKKSFETRTVEIQRLVEEGNRATQIAQKLGISEDNVRGLARRAGIQLADAAIGKRRRPDARRILTETINGVDAYVSGLSMLDGADLPALSTEERDELMQALSRSINGLRKLRTQMENAYARNDATAA